MLLIKDDSKPASNSNLRPIAISSNIVKIYEQILKNRIDDQLERAMDPNQIGFVKKMGCEVHLQKMLQTLHERKRMKTGS